MKKIITWGLLVIMALPSLALASFNTNLKFGLRNDDVSDLQELLVDEGCLTVSPTGYFGLLTLKGVKCFQTKYNISPVSGYFGILSRTKANELLASTTADSDAAELKELGAITPIEQPIITPTKPTPQPITLVINNPVCISSTTSRLSVSTDWDRVYQVLIRYNGTTNQGILRGGRLLTKGEDWINEDTYGTIEYTATTHEKPVADSAWNIDYGKELSSVTGTLIFPKCK